MSISLVAELIAYLDGNCSLEPLLTVQHRQALAEELRELVRDAASWDEGVGRAVNLLANIDAAGRRGMGFKKTVVRIDRADDIADLHKRLAAVEDEQKRINEFLRTFIK